jgi:uncharacterized repeat protein (TIGR01451 family)
MHDLKYDGCLRLARLLRFVSSALILIVLTTSFAAVARSQFAPAIASTPLVCMPTTEFSVVDTVITPSDQIRTGRIYFRSDSYPDFYYVELTRTGDHFQAVLPKPMPETQRVIFYFEAVDVSFNITTTPESEADVVENADACRRRDPKAAFYQGGAPNIIVGATSAAAPALPPGFAIEGIAQVISVAGAAGGIGAGTLTLAAVGGAVAAGVGVGVIKSDKPTTTESPGSTGPGTGGSAPDTIPSTTTTTINVVVNSPLKACFETKPSPPVIMEGERITLDGRCSTPKEGLAYEWDLGDGRTRTGSFVEPTYNVPGSYRVTLSVRKLSAPNEQDSVSDTIRVQSVPEPSTTSTTSTTSTSTTTTSTTVPPDLTADLEVAIKPAIQCPCQAFDYTLTVINHGPDIATGVTLIDTLPEQLCLKCAGVTSLPPNCTFTSRCPKEVIECNWRELPSGASTEVNLRLSVPELPTDTTLYNNAEVFGNETDPNPYNSSVGGKITITPCVGFRQLDATLISSLEIGPPDGRAAANLLMNRAQLRSINNAVPYRFQIEGRPGRNSVEAYLVSGTKGEAIWRFDFSGAEHFVPGSIEVARGDVVTRDARQVVFRLSEKPGDRVVFTFLLEP